MIKVSNPIASAPSEFKTELQEKTYKALKDLSIEFLRVDNEPAITMEDCIAIDDMLKMKTVKSLLLCNRQQTNFYLFVTAGDKPFVTKNFGAALGVSRVSFASSEQLMNILGVEVGATTIYGALLDSAKDVRVVFDREVVDQEYYGCTDGTTTSYMKVKTKDIIDKLIPYTKHSLEIIEV